MTSKINKDNKIKTPKSHCQDSIPSFIRKTYDILDERKFPAIIDWNEEGTALVIKNPTEFCQKVLPAYFKHNNLTSFVRQLNMYNFHKRRTQSLDHIYYHELFQQGKKHLLKDIRRKAHENALEKNQKAVESPESNQQEQDFSTLSYENQFLKKLYNDAMSKITALETQVNEMTTKNQTLLVQFNQNKPVVEKIEKQIELTQEQLPMTLGQFSIPLLKLTVKRESSTQEPFNMAKSASINSFLNFGEEATDSTTATEVSQSSPMVQQSIESDKCFDMSDALCLPPMSLIPQVTEAPKPRNDLFISKGEMSVGQLFEAFNSDGLNSLKFEDEGSLLGKRPFEFGSTSFAEPAMKRTLGDLSIFSKKGMTSGAEEREMFRMMLRRESSINDGMVETDLDLMDLNTANPFSAWTKST